jgi:hypothetical protein
MSFRDPHFPPSLDPLPEGGEMDVYYSTRHLVLPPKGRNIAGTVCAAFEDNFQLTLEGKTAIPIQFGPKVPDTRGRIARLLGRGEAPVIAHTPMTGEGHLVKARTTQEIQHLFPRDSIEDVGNGWQLVRQQPREEVYFEQRGDREKIVDRREKLQSQSLLPLLYRSELEKHGKIVYESDPRHAQKLCVGVRHFHGRPTSYLEYLAFDPHLAEIFRRHQDEVFMMHKGMLELRPGLHTYLETFPEQNDPEQREYAEEVLETSPVLCKNIANIKKATNLMSPTSVGFFECDVTDRVISINDDHHTLKNIRGDGRISHEEKERARLSSINKDRALYSRGGVGIASDLMKRQAESDHYVFDISHQELVTRMNEHVWEGQMAMVIYGAGHFDSGYHDKNFHRKLLEKYTSLLPHFQFVVVEPHSYETLDKGADAFLAAIGKFTPEQYANFKRLQQRFTDMRKAMTIAILTANHTDIDRLDKELQRAVEEMRHVFHPQSTKSTYAFSLQPGAIEESVLSISPHDEPFNPQQPQANSQWAPSFTISLKDDPEQK